MVCNRGDTILCSQRALANIRMLGQNHIGRDFNMIILSHPMEDGMIPGSSCHIFQLQKTKTPKIFYVWSMPYAAIAHSGMFNQLFETSRKWYFHTMWSTKRRFLLPSFDWDKIDEPKLFPSHLENCSEICAPLKPTLVLNK